MHILLIDDSTSTRSLLRTLINSGQAERHQISEAASGEESLQKIASGEIKLPDIIILDLNMDGMTGYELSRELRQRYSQESDIIPYIIVVTANEGVDVINRVLDSGANDYMSKPVNVKILQVRLRVAERLLAHSSNGGGSAPTPALAIDPRQSLIASAIDQTDVPVALVEAGVNNPSFRIIYANAAMTVTTQYAQDQLIGQSLAAMEAWTDEFMETVLGHINQGMTLAHVPLGSNTQQEITVHLSFYPVRSGDEPVGHYLVVHHM